MVGFNGCFFFFSFFFVGGGGISGTSSNSSSSRVSLSGQGSGNGSFGFSGTIINISSGEVNGLSASFLADISLSEEVKTNVHRATGGAETIVGKTKGGDLGVFRGLGSDLGTNFREGGLFVLISDVSTDFIGEVHFGLKSLSDHILFDLILFSHLFQFVLFVLLFEFVGFFLFDLDNNISGLSNKGFLFIFFDVFDLHLFLVVFFLFSVSQHFFEAFSFLFKFFGLVFDFFLFVEHVSLLLGLLGIFDFEVFRDGLELTVEFFLFLVLERFFFLDLVHSFKGFFFDGSDGAFFLTLDFFDLAGNFSVQLVHIHGGDGLDITVLEVSKGYHPVFFSLVIFIAESINGSFLGFFNFNPGLDVVGIKVGGSLHNLETVSTFPSSRSHHGTNLLHIDSLDKGVNVRVFEKRKSLFVQYGEHSLDRKNRGVILGKIRGLGVVDLVISNDVNVSLLKLAHFSVVKIASGV